MPALLGEPDERLVAEALAGCPSADVLAWVKENLASNVQSQRCWLNSLVPGRKGSPARQQGAKA